MADTNLVNLDLNFDKDPANCLVYNVTGSRGNIVSRKALCNTLLHDERTLSKAKFKTVRKKSPKICSEGNSWINILWPASQAFGHHMTFFDVIEQAGYYTNSVAFPGDTFKNMLIEKEYEQPIKSGIFDYFIFSGGGNDLLGGGALCNVLKWKDEGAKSLNPKDYVYRKLLNNTLKDLRAGYQSIANNVWVWSGKKTQMLVHGYDYPIPQRNGPWLGTPFQNKGYDLVADEELINSILKHLVDRMYRMLKNVAKKSKNVTVVNLRNVCNNRWNDELHPKTSASRDFAKKFIDIIGPA